MKKITALLLAILTLFCFTACGEAPVEEEVIVPSASPTQEPEATPEPTPKPTSEPVVIPYESEKWQSYDRIVYNLANSETKLTFLNTDIKEVYSKSFALNEPDNTDEVELIKSDWSDADAASMYTDWGYILSIDFTQNERFTCDAGGYVYGEGVLTDREQLMNVYPATENTDAMGKEYINFNNGDYMYKTVRVHCKESDNDPTTIGTDCALSQEYATMLNHYFYDKGIMGLDPTEQELEYCEGLVQAKNEALLEELAKYDIEGLINTNEINNIAYPLYYTAIDISKQVEEEYNKKWLEEHGDLSAAVYQQKYKDYVYYCAEAQYELVGDIIEDINSRGGDVYLTYNPELVYYAPNFTPSLICSPVDFPQVYYKGGGIVEAEGFFDERVFETGEFFSATHNYEEIYSVIIESGNGLRISGFFPAQAFESQETLQKLFFGDQVASMPKKEYSVEVYDCMDFEAKYLGKRLKDIAPITQDQAQEYVAGVKEHFT